MKDGEEKIEILSTKIMTKWQKVKVVNNAVPLMMVTFTIFANVLVMIRLQDRL